MMEKWARSEALALLWNDGIVVDKRILSIFNFIVNTIIALTQQSRIPKPIFPIFQHSNIPTGAKPLTC
jgi:hypothetical protein